MTSKEDFKNQYRNSSIEALDSIIAGMLASKSDSNLLYALTELVDEKLEEERLILLDDSELIDD